MSFLLEAKTSELGKRGTGLFSGSKEVENASEVRWKASLKEVIVSSAGLKVAGEKARVGLFFSRAAKSWRHRGENKNSWSNQEWGLFTNLRWHTVVWCAVIETQYGASLLIPAPDKVSELQVCFLNSRTPRSDLPNQSYNKERERKWPEDKNPVLYHDRAIIQNSNVKTASWDDKFAVISKIL